MTLRLIEGFETIADSTDFGLRFGGTSQAGSDFAIVSGREHGSALDAGIDGTPTIIDETLDAQTTWIIGLQLGYSGSGAGRFGTAEFNIIELYDSATLVFYVGLQRDPEGVGAAGQAIYKLRFYRGDGYLIGETADNFDNEGGVAGSNAGVYNRLEFKVTLDPTAGSVQAKVNGATAFELDEIQTVPDAETTADQLIFTFNKLGVSDTLYVDDIVVADGSGTENNDFLGDVAEYARFPVSDGNSADWTPSTGVDNYAMVDEEPIDSDTTYNRAASVVTDLYGLNEDDFRFTGIVLGVATKVVARLESAGSESLQHLLRYNGANSVIGTSTVDSTSYQSYSQFIEEPVGEERRFFVAEVRDNEWGVASTSSTPIRVSRFAVSLLLVVSSGEASVTPLTLQTIRNPALPDWTNGITVNTAWLTDVTKSRNLAEERVGLVDRPYRTMTVTYGGLFWRVISQILMNAMRHGETRTQIPFYPHQTKLTSAVTGGATVLPCDALYRPLHAGARVLVHDFEMTAEGECIGSNFEYATIDAVENDAIILTAGLTNSYATGARVLPVLDVEINLDSTMSFLTDESGESQLAVTEVFGASALPNQTILPPLDIDFYDSKPILSIRADWNSQPRMRVIRDGQAIDLGRSTLIDTQGDRARLLWELNFRFLERSTAWDFLQFFDYVKGRLRRFWLVNPVTVFKAEAITTTKVTVTVTGEITDFQDFIDYIAIVERDGTTQIRAVSSIALVSGSWEITFDTAISSVSLADIRFVTSAHLCRFDQDEFVENWISNEVMEGVATITEVLQEGDVDLGDFIRDEGDFADLAFETILSTPNLYLFTDASVHAYKQTDSNGDTYTRLELARVSDRVGIWDDVRRSPSTPWLQTPDGGQSPEIHVSGLEPVINGHRGMFHQGTIVSGFNEFYLQNSQEPFFSNTDGLTVFWAGFMRPAVVTGQEEGYIFLKRAGVIHLHYRGADLYETVDVANSNLNIQIPTGAQFFTAGKTLIMAFRWDPGVSAEMWKDGVSVGTPTTQVSTLPTDERLTRVCGFIGVEPYPPDEADFATSCITKSFLIYRRALSNSEMNAIGQELAAQLFIPWNTIS